MIAEEKVLIKLCKVNETNEMCLLIDDYRVVGIKGGFGNTLKKSWVASKKDILRAMREL